MDKITFIYALCDESGHIRYVGKSDNPKHRLRKHILESRYKRTHKEKWVNNLVSNGFELTYMIIDEVSVSEWSFWEEYWICQIKSWGFKLVNGTSGGEGSDGFRGKKHSDETKLKCAEAAKKGKVTKLFGDKNGGSKIKDYQVIEIFEKKKLGMSNKELGLEYGLNPKYIYQILTGRKRKNLSN